MGDSDSNWRAHVMRVAASLQPENFQPWSKPWLLGCTLQEAMTAFVPVGARGMVSSYLARVDAGIEEPNAITRMQAWLWEVLRGQLRCGQLTARGRLAGSIHSDMLPADLFDDATADFGNNRITTGDGVIAGLRVFSSSPLSRETLDHMPATSPTISITSGATSSKRRLDYRTIDAPLIAEMNRLISSGEATGPMNAARAVVRRAMGKGNDDSRVKRLIRHYRELRSQTGQTGQN